MHAGMLAALLIGAVRTAVEFTTDPLRILAMLNDDLLGRGMATCLIVRIDQQGEVSAANAGHLAPYLNGREMQMEGALPLGVAEGAEFSTALWQMSCGDRLLLITDGVVEAQGESGDFFGFDGVQALLGVAMSAKDVAEAAQKFGQQDDITVVSIRRDDQTDRTQEAQTKGIRAARSHSVVTGCRPS
jgi:serine phosphatase RsbU (regulator of sigma subunit)